MKATIALSLGLGVAPLVSAIGGGFLATCCNVDMRDTTLWASCKNRAGGWDRTGLDLNHCLVNDNGNLKVQSE